MKTDRKSVLDYAILELQNYAILAVTRHQALMKIANRYNGAFLCDGVGLGKTFIGLMLIERLLMKEKKCVVLIVQKSARKPVWEAKIMKYIPEIMKGSSSGLILFKNYNFSNCNSNIAS